MAEEEGHSETGIPSLLWCGQVDPSRTTPFVFVSDEPPVLRGRTQEPNAVELVLAPLASCLSVGIAYDLALRSMTLQEVQLQIADRG